MAWTPGEQQSSLEVARDIGQAVLNARNLAREQRLVSELRQLASYKTELLSTVSHELKNPLSAISGHLELVAGPVDLEPDVQFSVAAMERASRRLVRLVDDLLTARRGRGPRRPRHRSAPVDLRPLLAGDARAGPVRRRAAWPARRGRGARRARSWCTATRAASTGC